MHTFNHQRFRVEISERFLPILIYMYISPNKRRRVFQTVGAYDDKIGTRFGGNGCNYVCGR
jgi:hypothetical protein